jgi:hypothetical protein
MKIIILLFASSLFFGVLAKSQWTDPRPVGSSGPFKNFNVYTHNTALDGSFVNFNNIENTKGKRYLFDDWAKGNVTMSAGGVINSDSLYYNFDKMSSSLLVTTDKKNIIAVNRSDISSFTLSDTNTNYNFERVDAINPRGFLQVLEKKDKGYILYKSITTKFEKASYHTDGLMESGKPYDEYSDQYKYYIALPDNKGYKNIVLKVKGIKEAFSGNPKFEEYTSAHKNALMDESYLIELIRFLNQ